MSIRPFRASVGLRRILAGISESQAAVTRQSRAQMQSVVKRFKEFERHMISQMPEILREALEPTFEKSQKYVPVDTGDLKESGFLQVVKTRSGAFVSMGYGLGGRPPYSVFVHEDLEASHKPPTRAKFLQSALEEDSSLIERRIQSLLRRAASV